MRFTAVLVPEDGGFVAHCLELGVASQGDTVETALQAIREAVEVTLEESPEKGALLRRGSGSPLVTTVEIAAA